jgi:membrane protein
MSQSLRRVRDRIGRIRGRNRVPAPDEGPPGPWDLGLRRLRRALRRTVSEAMDDRLTEWAAALTYYSVLSLFPGLLVLVALVSLLSDSLTKQLLDVVAPVMPGAAREILVSALESSQAGQGKAGIAALVGLLIAFWSATGYVGGFMEAANVIYDVPEGRPIWKRLPIRLGVTFVTGVLLLLSVAIVVLSGRIAVELGRVLGLSQRTVDLYQVIRWPVLVILVGFLFSLLYWAAPNARQGGWRWISPGSVLAVVLWLAASLGFGLYAAKFARYNATYGALGGVIIFLIWLWISNLAILVGGELDAELQRQRAIAAGLPEDHEPYLRLRDGRDVHHDAEVHAPGKN